MGATWVPNTPFSKFVGAMAPMAPMLTHPLPVHTYINRALVSVGAAAPTDFWNGAFAPTLFTKNSITLVIKLTKEFKNQKSAPTDLKILTRALLCMYAVC